MWLETATSRVHSSIRQSIGFLIRRLWVRFPLNAPFFASNEAKNTGSHVPRWRIPLARGLCWVQFPSAPCFLICWQHFQYVGNRSLRSRPLVAIPSVGASTRMLTHPSRKTRAAPWQQPRTAQINQRRDAKHPHNKNQRSSRRPKNASNASGCQHNKKCVCSSVEERCLAMAEVAGSNPARCFEIASVDVGVDKYENGAVWLV